MKYLVGDIGNTLTKISLINSNFKIKKSYNIITNTLSKKKILKKFFNKILLSQINKKILFSSVVPNIFQSIKNELKNFDVYEIHDLKIKNLIKFKVDNYKKVGSDRIANAIGSHHIYKKDCIVIDFGTATTFDIIKKAGVYEGGVIAPGINLSIKNLNKSTALLPILNLKSSNRIYGKNTNDALNAGFIWGYQGLINNIIKKITLSSKTNYKVILTGGYAKFFNKYINMKLTINENITILGIVETYRKLLK